MITVKDLIQYRMRHERLVRKIAEANLPTGYGAFRIHAFESLIDGEHHVALVMGEITPEDDGAGARALAVPDRRHLRAPPAATAASSCTGRWS